MSEDLKGYDFGGFDFNSFEQILDLIVVNQQSLKKYNSRNKSQALPEQNQSKPEPKPQIPQVTCSPHLFSYPKKTQFEQNEQIIKSQKKPLLGLDPLGQMSMRSSDYHYFYLQRYRTVDMLTKYVHLLEKEDEKKYVREIGQFLYQFQIRDLYGAWRVLKTHHQVQKYLEIRHNQYAYFRMTYNLKKIDNADHFQDKQFEIIAPAQAYNFPIPDYVVKFFEIYNVNIQKLTSFLMQKKTRAMTWIKKCENWCFGAEWSPRRIIITREGVIEMADDGSVTDFLKFDLYFSMRSGMAATQQEYGIALMSAQRKIVLKARNARQFVIFLFYLSKAMQMNNQKINYLGSCRRSQKNNIDYYVDAKDYYEAVAHQIDRAERDIMICGWWVSPQLYLIRPLKQESWEYWRLDKLLKRKAEKGVKIYIVVFFAPSVIPNDSDYTKKALTSLHPNIVVQRHPHQILPKLWSHHEKAVIIDQKVALMGGLDLCYGRFDSHDHPINANNKEMYPGIDYNNVRIKDFVTVSKFQQDLQDRNLPRMPWHDVAFRVEGKIVSDVANHFVEYWNFTVLEKSVAPVVTKSKQQSQNKSQSRENLQSVQALTKQSTSLVSSILQVATQKEQKKFQYYMTNKSKRQKLGKALRTEWLKKKIQLNNGPGQNCLLLSIQSLGLLKEDPKFKKQRESQLKDQLQLLRSASEWSIGLEEGATQRSIQNAYLSAIKNAQRFIYIQNQFFISATGEKDSYVQNQIANALYQRIKKSIEKSQKFRVVVFMPLLPGMQGELTQKCPLSLKLTMYWQFNTISQSKYSLLARVAQLTPHPQDYIQFYSLRSHGLLGDQPVTELIYIHTKLMIVDDHVVICGSANINDRSQEGDRDSELAVIFTNGQKTKASMNKQKYQVNRKAHELRMKLFVQHFGLTEREAEDPLSQKSIALTRQIAKTNTETYRQIFGCCPDDNVKKLADVRNFQKTSSEKTTELYKGKLGLIRGHAVQFPTQFLSEEKLFRLDLSKIQDIFT